MKLQKSILATMVMLASSLTCATESNQTDHQFKNEDINKQVALAVSAEKNRFTKYVEHQHKIDWLLAPVKNKVTLDELVASKSPLDMLSPAAKERFVDSIVFRKGGLGGFYAGDLIAELTPTQIHQVLSLFGAQRTIKKLTGLRIETKLDAMLTMSIDQDSDFKDYMGYKCSARATCSLSTSDICMSGC